MGLRGSQVDLLSGHYLNVIGWLDRFSFSLNSSFQGYRKGHRAFFQSSFGVS